MPITVDDKGSPIIVTGTTSSAEEVMPRSEKAHIKYLYWYNATTAGDLLTLVEGEGREIITMRAEADNTSQQWDIDTQYYGLQITDMDSGKLYIYIS